MGTNYYLKSPPCPHCGKAEEPLHIGKSSAGWCFSLHVIPEAGINSLDDWLNLFTIGSMKIYDEYDTQISKAEMVDVITNISRDWLVSAGFDFESNHAEPGPNNLVRYKVDGVHCIGHGKGTWDLIAGEFS